MEIIALFGGSFDPPHIGHEAVVKALLDLDFLDGVVIMPTSLNPFKSTSHASPEQRFLWLKEIFSNEKKVIVDDFEVVQNRQVPSIESVKYLLKTYKKIYLVVGADILKDLGKWHKYDELKKLVTFIVAHRDKIEVPKEFLDLKIDETISSSDLRKQMDESKLNIKCAQEIAYKYKENNEK